MKKNNTDHDKTINDADRPCSAQDLTKEPDMVEKIMADASALIDEAPLTGWALLAQDIAQEEAERQRTLQAIPDFRTQAVNTIAYWTSLSSRVESLGRTRQLLARMPGQSAPDTADSMSADKAKTND